MALQLKTYTVEHMVGIAGVTEKDVETYEGIRAESPEQAVAQFTNWPDGKNPDSTQGGSGRYNDYWMATELDEEATEEEAR